MVAYIEAFNKDKKKLPYILGSSPNLKKEVIFNPDWVSMITDNTVPILGWIQYEKVKWLQHNNPEVPALIYKLSPLNDKMRKLGHVRNLWSEIIAHEKVKDVFTNKDIVIGDYDVDHFVPWSFVMNTQEYSSTTRSAHSLKSATGIISTHYGQARSCTERATTERPSVAY